MDAVTTAEIAAEEVSSSTIRAASGLVIKPIGADFGAIVEGVRWDAIDEEVVATITRALRRHLLLVFRGQSSPGHVELDGFFRPFGRLVSESVDGNFHYQTFTDSDNDQVHRKGSFNYVVNTPGEGQTELVWHNDHFHRPQLKAISVLEAIEFEDGAVPTEFRDMYTAYEMLPGSVRSELEMKMTCNLDPRRLDLERWPRLADSMHPVFQPHPHSGRKTLFVGEWTHRIVGFSQAESDRRLAWLLEHARANAPHYVHHWQVGDICVWDNIGLQHRRDAMIAGQRRVLRAYEGIAE